MSQIKKYTIMPPNVKPNTKTSVTLTEAREERPILRRVDSKMDLSDYNDANISSGKSAIVTQHIEISSTNTDQLNLPKHNSNIEMLEISDISQLSVPLSSNTPTTTTTTFEIPLSALIAARPNSAGNVTKHPQRAFRSAFKAFSEQRLAELEKDSKFQLLTKPQKESQLLEEFEASDENPVILLPGVKETLANLQERGMSFVIKTNYQNDDCDLGENGRAITDLSKILNLPSLSPEQLIQLPTPFRKLVLKYRRKAVLVFSPGLDEDEDERVREYADSLGFEDVFTPRDYYAVWPHLAPTGYIPGSPPNRTSPQAKRLFNTRNQKGPAVEIKAILVFGQVDPKAPNGKHTLQNGVVTCEGGKGSLGRGYQMPTKLLIPILKSHTGDIRIPSPFNGKKCLPNEGWGQA